MYHGERPVMKCLYELISQHNKIMQACVSHMCVYFVFPSEREFYALWKYYNCHTWRLSCCIVLRREKKYIRNLSTLRCNNSIPSFLMTSTETTTLRNTSSSHSNGPEVNLECYGFGTRRVSRKHGVPSDIELAKPYNNKHSKATNWQYQNWA